MSLKLAQVSKVAGRETHIQLSDLSFEPGTLNVFARSDARRQDQFDALDGGAGQPDQRPRAVAG